MSTFFVENIRSTVLEVVDISKPSDAVDMGIKMPSAINDSLRQEIRALAAEGLSRSTWTCATSDCTASVHLVGEHKRVSPDGVSIVVPAFFRLNPHQHHADHCRFNLEGFVQHVYATSSSDVLEALKNGQYRFRLHLLDGPLRRFRHSSFKTGSGGTTNPRPSDVLDPYLNVLTQVLLLRAAIEQQKDLAKLIQLDFGGTPVSWDHFYYGPDDYFAAHEYLLNGGQNTHPIVLNGYVKKTQPPKGRIEDPELYLAGEMRQVNERKDVVSARARLRASIPGLSPAKQVLIFGRWRADPVASDGNEPPIYFYRLQTDVYRPKQILIVP